VLKIGQGFRLNLGGGVDQRHAVEWFKVYFWKAKDICCEATQLSAKETEGGLGYFKCQSGFVTFPRCGQNGTVLYLFQNVNC